MRNPRRSQNLGVVALTLLAPSPLVKTSWWRPCLYVFRERDCSPFANFVGFPLSMDVFNYSQFTISICEQWIGRVNRPLTFISDIRISLFSCAIEIPIPTAFIRVFSTYIKTPNGEMTRTHHWNEVLLHARRLGLVAETTTADQLRHGLVADQVKSTRGEYCFAVAYNFSCAVSVLDIIVLSFACR